MKRWRDILFDNGFEEHYHIHIGMRIIKTALAVFVCGLIGWLRDQDSVNFFSMIAAVICIQKSAEATIKNSFNRVIGTAIGGTFGVALLFAETQLRMQRFMPLYLLVTSLLIIPIIVSTLVIHKPTVTGFACMLCLYSFSQRGNLSRRRLLAVYLRHEPPAGYDYRHYRGPDNQSCHARRGTHKAAQYRVRMSGTGRAGPGGEKRLSSCRP